MLDISVGESNGGRFLLDGIAGSVDLTGHGRLSTELRTQAAQIQRMAEKDPSLRDLANTVFDYHYKVGRMEVALAHLGTDKDEEAASLEQWKGEAETLARAFYSRSMLDAWGPDAANMPEKNAPDLVDLNDFEGLSLAVADVVQVTGESHQALSEAMGYEASIRSLAGDVANVLGEAKEEADQVKESLSPFVDEREVEKLSAPQMASVVADKLHEVDTVLETLKGTDLAQHLHNSTPAKMIELLIEKYLEDEGAK